MHIIENIQFIFSTRTLSLILSIWMCVCAYPLWCCNWGMARVSALVQYKFKWLYSRLLYTITAQWHPFQFPVHCHFGFLPVSLPIYLYLLFTCSIAPFPSAFRVSSSRPSTTTHSLIAICISSVAHTQSYVYLDEKFIRSLIFKIQLTFSVNVCVYTFRQTANWQRRLTYLYIYICSCNCDVFVWKYIWDNI